MNTTGILNMIEQIRLAFKKLYEAFSKVLGGTHGTPSADAELEAILSRKERINNHREFLKKRFAPEHIINENKQNQVCRYWNSRSKHTDFIK